MSNFILIKLLCVTEIYLFVAYNKSTQHHDISKPDPAIPNSHRPASGHHRIPNGNTPTAPPVTARP